MLAASRAIFGCEQVSPFAMLAAYGKHDWTAEALDPVRAQALMDELVSAQEPTA